MDIQERVRCQLNYSDRSVRPVLVVKAIFIVDAYFAYVGNTYRDHHPN